MRQNYNGMFAPENTSESDVDEFGMPYKKAPEESEEESPIEPKTYTVITKGKLNVRRHPSAGMQSEMICQLRPGDKVQVESIEDDWAHIYTSSGIEGYVMAEFIKEG